MKNGDSSNSYSLDLEWIDDNYIPIAVTSSYYQGPNAAALWNIRACGPDDKKAYVGSAFPTGGSPIQNLTLKTLKEIRGGDKVRFVGRTS